MRRLLFVAALVMGAACSGDDSGRVALVGATVVPGTDQRPIRNAVVVISGGRIESVGLAGEVDIPRGTEEIDLTGRWIIPGLIDTDAKAEAWALSRYIAYGVTALRDVRTPTEEIVGRADETEMSVVLGPRIYFSGTPVGDMNNGGLSATESRKLVDDNSLAGSDFIALGPTASPTMVKAAADEASSFQLPVVATLGLTDAVTATGDGIHSIVGLTGIPQAAAGSAAPFYAAYRQGNFQGWRETGRGWSRLRAGSLNRIADRLIAAYVSITPNLVVHEVAANLDDPSVLEAPEQGAIPAEMASGWDGAAIMRERGWSAADLRVFRQGRTVQDRFVAEFKERGGVVAAGSGAPGPYLVPGASLHMELQLLVRIGLTPQEALMAATSTAAAVLGVDSLGTVAAGQVADMLVLTADPLQDIRNTRAIETVILRGHMMLVEGIRQEWLSE